MLMKRDLILGWEVEEKQLEGELYYKIVGDGGVIIKNSSVVGNYNNLEIMVVLTLCERYCNNKEHPKLWIFQSIDSNKYFLSKGRVKSRTWGVNLMWKDFNFWMWRWGKIDLSMERQ
jgi:hypothetical protein